MAPKRPTRGRSTPAFPLTVIQAIQVVLTYGRVSTDLQRDTESIKIQVTKLEGTIAVRANPELPIRDQLQLAGAYYDDGISGTVPFEERPEGRKLMQRICPRTSTDCEGDCRHAGEINQVWITKLDRLARKLQILIDIEAWLRRHNVSLICMDPAIDTSTGTGRLVFTVLAAIAEWERETILERTVGGKHHKASEGKWVGGRRTFGLTTDEEGYLVVDETLMEKTGEMAYRMVQSIFDNVALHESTTWRESQRTGLSERRVGWILHNPRYKGEGGIYDKDGNWTAATKNFPPQIVGPDTWQRAQEQLIKNRRNSGGVRHYPYLLSGLLICCEPYDHEPVILEDGSGPWGRHVKVEGMCGRRFAGRIEKRHQYHTAYAYYYCTRTLKSLTNSQKHGCTAKMIRVSDAEDVIWTLVKRFVRNPGDLLREADSTRADMIARLKVELTTTVDRLGRLGTEIENVNRSREEGLRNWDSAAARTRELQAQSKTLEQERDALEMQIKGLGYDEFDVQRSEVLIEQLSNELDDIEARHDTDAMRTLIQAVVKRIEVRTINNRPTLRVHMVYGGNVDALLNDLKADPELRVELQNSLRTAPQLGQGASGGTQNAELVLDMELPEPRSWKTATA
jgi:site-specific DNA recombinase